jgi:hypothetical protein
MGEAGHGIPAYSKPGKRKEAAGAGNELRMHTRRAVFGAGLGAALGAALLAGRLQAQAPSKKPKGEGSGAGESAQGLDMWAARVG